MSKLRFDITSGATSLTMDSVNSIPNSGYVQIDSEIMHYSYRGDISLLSLTRGTNSTMAASHTAGTSITFLPEVLSTTVFPGPVSVSDNYSTPGARGEIVFSNGTKVTVSGDTVVFTNAAGSKSFTVTMS